MPLPAFLLFSTIGSLIWTSFLALSGYLLGQSYELIDEYVGPVSNLIVLSIVVLYVYRVITFKPESRRAPSRAE